jgi:hypothetical protein
MAQYQFVGDGMGVPGLPHMISDEEAAELGVSELLMAAVENGNYQAFDASTTSETSTRSPLSAEEE